ADLCLMDHLWMNSSKGHFGFTIQSQIWQQQQHDYVQFAQTVGWAVSRGREWRNYADLIFRFKRTAGTFTRKTILHRTGFRGRMGGKFSIPLG
ncbi:MAG TPA: GUN4 domain-containing protein, partial [Vampirovibrionales bacterium]